MNLLVSYGQGSVLGGGLVFANVTTKSFAWDADGTQTVSEVGRSKDAWVDVFDPESGPIQPLSLTAILPDDQIVQLSIDDPWITSTKKVLPLPRLLLVVL